MSKCVLDRRRWVIAEFMQPASWLAPFGCANSFAGGVRVPNQNIAKMYLVVPGWTLLWCLKQRKAFVRGKEAKQQKRMQVLLFHFDPSFSPSTHSFFAIRAANYFDPRFLMYTLSDDS